EDGIRDFHVTGVQTCALPILQLDDLILATFSHHVETLTGLRTVPQRRRKTRYTASRHGSDDFDPFFDELRLPIDISLWPWDEDRSEERRVGEGGRRATRERRW